MKRNSLLLFLILLLCLQSARAEEFWTVRGKKYSIQGAQAPTKKEEKPLYVPGELLVKLKRKVSPRRATSLFGAMGAQAANEFSPQLYKVQIASFAPVEQAVHQYEQNPDVEYAEPNYYVYADGTAFPNDPEFTKLWGMHNTGQSVNTTLGTADADIDAPEAWSVSVGEQNTITVAVLDSGVLANHPDLVANLLTNGTDTINNDNDPRDGNHHGTHVSGTIAAVMNNGIGVTGVNPKAKILPIKVLADNGTGTVAAVVNGINYAVNNGAKLLNMSLGNYVYSQSTYDALNAAKNSGILVVAAAGNDTNNNDVVAQYPSGFDLANILAVAATAQDDTLASFSNYGAATVDVAAPGANILSTSLFPLFDNFDLSSAGQLPPGWKQAGTNANWTVTDESFVSSPNSLTDNAGVNYENNTDSLIYYDSLLTNKNEPVNTFSFFLYTDFADGVDSLNVVYSTDKKTWTTMVSYTGAGAGAHSATKTLDISALMQDVKSLYLGFRLITDGSDVSDGVHIDNVKFLGGDGGYEFINGTSMATPCTAGLASLIWSLKPTLTYAEVKDIIMNSVEKKGGLTGKVVTGGRINAYNAIKLIPGINIVEPGNADVRAGDNGYVEPEAGKNATIQIQPSGSGTVEVNIYTLTGSLVYTTSFATTGTQQTVTWDGRTNAGELVASGIYRLEIKGPGLNQNKKIAVIK